MVENCEVILESSIDHIVFLEFIHISILYQHTTENSVPTIMAQPYLIPIKYTVYGVVRIKSLCFVDDEFPAENEVLQFAVPKTIVLVDDTYIFIRYKNACVQNPDRYIAKIIHKLYYYLICILYTYIWSFLVGHFKSFYL